MFIKLDDHISCKNDFPKSAQFFINLIKTFKDDIKKSLEKILFDVQIY